MDGAAGRVSLRGMALLRRSRERRERDAEAEVARRLGEARRAAMAVEHARDALEEQRVAWRERERTALLGMQGVATPSGRLTAHWVEMDRLADESVRLKAECTAAEAGQARAEEDVERARGALRRAARLVQRSDVVIGRIQRWRDRVAETAEAIEGEDDAIRRHASRCCG